MRTTDSGRPTHGAAGTVGGGLADWLIGAGVFALLLAAFGLWGLPLLYPPTPEARPGSRAATGSGAGAGAGPVADLPLTVLPAIEAPAPPAADRRMESSGQGLQGGSTPPPADEPLRSEVAALIDSPGRAPAIEAARADGFVDGGQAISLPAAPVAARTTLAALAERLGNDPQAEVTLQREVVAVQPRRLVDLLQQAAVDAGAKATGKPRPLEGIARDLQQVSAEDDDPAALAQLSRALSEAGIDPAARFTVELAEGPRELPLTELLGRGLLAHPEATVGVVERSRSIETTTLAALRAEAEGGAGGGGGGGGGGEAAGRELTVLEGGGATGRTTTIGELLGSAAGSSDTLYYVRTVQAGDEQGVWGIVQRGVTETFSRGVSLGEGDSRTSVTLAIPTDADELEGRRSSFLGRLISSKVEASWVYNLGDGRMGRNPHLVYPGQELVIVAFAPAELNAIYAHFTGTGE